MSSSDFLSYYQPEDLRPHTSLHIPGSHTLYVGPASCARRHALHELEYGNPGSISTLAITETDLISGSYMEAIAEAVQDLLDTLCPSPHIFILVFFCIDDFLGTDRAELLHTLEKRFPGLRFTDEHIAPISVENPTQNIHMSRRLLDLYRFLEPSEHDTGVTFVGNFVSLPQDCELFSCLSAWGCQPIREMISCQTYEQYQAMAKSQLALSFRFADPEAKSFFQDVLGIPFFFFPPEYSVRRVQEYYARLAVLMGCPYPKELHQEAKTAQAEALQTAALFRQRGLSLALDSGAFLRPFSAALALVQYGFSVSHVFHGRRIWVDELPLRETLQCVHRVRILPKDDFLRRNLYPEGRTCLTLGSISQNILRAPYSVDLWHDEGYFGFHGIRRLMEALRNEVSS